MSNQLMKRAGGVERQGEEEMKEEEKDWKKRREDK